jgi:hypothetical protein
MHNNLVVADLSPSYPMLSALDDVQAIRTFHLLKVRRKLGMNSMTSVWNFLSL